MSAIEQLQLWETYQEYWCEHKPSITVYVRDHEWLEVGAYVYKNFDRISGISFLPHSDHSYKQAPYQEITEAQYEELLISFPKNISWEGLNSYETEDTTKGAQTFACSGDVCEIVDIT
jgi:ribonucleoside-diphosphate reductase alpha chain